MPRGGFVAGNVTSAGRDMTDATWEAQHYGRSSTTGAIWQGQHFGLIAPGAAWRAQHDRGSITGATFAVLRYESYITDAT